jgi:hypothetical protein
MISREEAVTVLSKLQSEYSRVLCWYDFPGFEVIFRGTILSVSESELHVSSPDKRSGIALRLDLDDMAFEYAEPKDMPLPQRSGVPEHAEDAATVLITLPLRVPLSFLTGPLRVPPRERLMIMEERDK